MKFAYADPPYPGQAKRWYGNHPDYAGEVDHAELIARLERDYPDGWALSTGTFALRDILPLCPPSARVVVWYNTAARPPGARKFKWFYTWEPVIIDGGRGAPKVKDLLMAPSNSGWMADVYGMANFPGGKPPPFSRWIFALLGATPDDELDDIFPGTGAVAREWQRFKQSEPLIKIEPAERLDAAPQAGLELGLT